MLYKLGGHRERPLGLVLPDIENRTGFLHAVGRVCHDGGGGVQVGTKQWPGSVGAARLGSRCTGRKKRGLAGLERLLLHVA